MLFALALGALAAALVTPIVLSQEPPEDDPGSPDTPEGLELPPLDPDGDVEATVEPGEPGNTYRVPASPGRYEIDGFDAEKDMFVVSLDSVDGMVETGIDDAGTPYLEAELEHGRLHVTFPGHDAVPESAVRFALPHDTLGDDGLDSLTLAEVLDRGFLDEVPGPDSTSFLLDWNAGTPELPVNEALDDLGEFSPVQPSADDPVDVFVPTGPGAPDEIDLPTASDISDLVPLAPTGGDVGDLLEETGNPKADLLPVRPNPGLVDD